MQFTITFDTLPLAVPSFPTRRSSDLEGCVRVVTLYAPPLGIGVLNVNDVAPAVTVRELERIFCNTNHEAMRHVIVPPMVKVIALQLTTTLVTLTLVVPVQMLIDQVCQ